MIFEKRKGLTTNPATRPFGVFVGSEIDVKEKFGKSGFYEVGKTVFVEEANMEIEYRKLGEKELDVFIEMRINQLREEGAKEDIDLKSALLDYYMRHMKDGTFVCNLRRASATDALTSGRLAEQNGRPPDNPNSVLQLDHHDIMLGDPLEDCVSRYCIVHDHGLPFVWFPLGTDDRAP